MSNPFFGSYNDEASNIKSAIKQLLDRMEKQINELIGKLEYTTSADYKEFFEIIDESYYELLGIKPPLWRIQYTGMYPCMDSLLTKMNDYLAMIESINESLEKGGYDSERLYDYSERINKAYIAISKIDKKLQTISIMVSYANEQGKNKGSGTSA